VSFQTEYKAFEDRFRGSRELIRQRLSVYLPLLESLGAVIHHRRALDIGSGRGEWLALIAEHGWQGVGVDSNADFAASAIDLGVSTENSDGLSFLQRCKAASFDLVTAFHVVEHVDADYRTDLFTEIRRVLAPGGLMIIETPNPQSLTVGSWSFHMDPTHVSPIPPPLLQYQVEAAGFPASVVLLLNGDLGGGKGSLPQILSVLFRSGPDYAVLAANVANAADDQVTHLKDFVAEHSQPNPADVSELLRIADSGEDRIASLEAELHRAKEMTDYVNSSYEMLRSTELALHEVRNSLRVAEAELAAEQQARLAEERARNVAIRHLEEERKANEERRISEASAIQLLLERLREKDVLVANLELARDNQEAVAKQAKKAARVAERRSIQFAERASAERLRMKNSTSWRVTAPLRAIGQAIRAMRLRSKPVRLLRGSSKIGRAKTAVSFLVFMVRRVPVARDIARVLVRRFPALRQLAIARSSPSIRVRQTRRSSSLPKQRIPTASGAVSSPPDTAHRQSRISPRSRVLYLMTHASKATLSD
jgi:SAM-dependent methyltransferase